MLLPSRFPHSWSAPMTRRRRPCRWRRAASPSSCTPRPRPYPLPGSRPAAHQAQLVPPDSGPGRLVPGLLAGPAERVWRASTDRPSASAAASASASPSTPAASASTSTPAAATPSSTATSGTTSAASARSSEPDRATRKRQRRQEPPSHRAPRQAAWQALAGRPMRRAGTRATRKTRATTTTRSQGHKGHSPKR